MCSAAHNRMISGLFLRIFCVFVVCYAVLEFFTPRPSPRQAQDLTTTEQKHTTTRIKIIWLGPTIPRNAVLICLNLSDKILIFCRITRGQYSSNSLSFAATFSALGSMACSSVPLSGIAGTSSLPKSITGASKLKQSDCTHCSPQKMGSLSREHQNAAVFPTLCHD